MPDFVPAAMGDLMQDKHKGSSLPPKPAAMELGEQVPENQTSSFYKMLKPLHNLPRGKNTWDPQFIKIWWFWPASAAVILLLSYLYPFVWDILFTGK